MTVAAIVRVSTDKQAERGLSLEIQRETIARYVARAGLDPAIVWLEDPGVSAGKPLRARPEGRRLFASADDCVLVGDGPHHVIACKLDRLFRDVVDGLTTLDAWDEDGAVTVHLVNEGGAEAIDVSTASGRFTLTMKLALAEMERRQVGERTTPAMALLKSQGRTTGNAPYGWRAGPNGVLVEDPDEQETIAEARRLHERARYPLRLIAATLAKGHHLSRSGKPFSHTAIAAMLKTP